MERRPLGQRWATFGINVAQGAIWPKSPIENAALRKKRLDNGKRNIRDQGSKTSQNPRKGGTSLRRTPFAKENAARKVLGWAVGNSGFPPPNTAQRCRAGRPS
jgi:hypothetical protein